MNTKGMKSSVIISIFKRKGGEGTFTKVINENNTLVYSSTYSHLIGSESPLIIYFHNDDKWILLTNERLLKKEDDVVSSFAFDDIKDVKMALSEEARIGSFDKKEFTYLRIYKKNNEFEVWEFEKGKPFQGFYQVLHFLCGNR